MTKEYVLEDIEKLTTFNFKPNCSITFHSANRKVGTLDFNGPEMIFSGDMDESAKLFLELVATSFKTRLEQERAVGYREGHMAALAQRTWVELTLDERIELAQDVDWAAGAYCEYAEKIESKLKDKNT